MWVAPIFLVPRAPGDLVAATVSGITCPGNANCTIKTWYDLGSGGDELRKMFTFLRWQIIADNSGSDDIVTSS
jgi:hypothetical protein